MSTTGTNGSTGTTGDEIDDDPYEREQIAAGESDYIKITTDLPSAPATGPKIAGVEADTTSETGISKTFNLEAVYDVPRLTAMGYALDPNPPTGNGLAHEWSYKEPTDIALSFSDSGSGRTITQKITALAKYRVECKVYLLKSDPDPAKRTKAFMVVDKKGRFAAIGGPLKLGVRDPMKFTAVPPGKVRLQTWEHLDKDETKPFYLQYFQSGEQIPQLGTAAAELNQPEGVHLTLTLPNSLSQETADTATTLPTDTRILVPHSEFISESVSGTFEYSFEDYSAGMESGTAEDITETFRDPAKPLVALIRTFTARAPKSLGNEPDLSVVFDPGNVWRCGSAGGFRLRDGFGSLMPGVFVQERFATKPQGFVGNQDKQAWISRLSSGEKVGFRDGIYTYDFPNPSQVVMGPGWLHLTDNIWWSSPQDMTINPIVHEFFAATKRNIVGEVGVSLGSYEINLILGTGPPGSKPGSATQTKTSN